MRTRLRSKVTLLFIVCAALLAFAGTAMALTADPSGTTSPSPTIQSDKADYGPGELVTLTGSGWQAGESVNIKVNDTNGASWSRNVDVSANANGEITDSFNLPDWFVSDYDVTATGAQSGTVTTTFTDALQTATTVTSSPNPSSVGQQVTFTGTVSCNPANNGCVFSTTNSMDFVQGANVNCNGGTTLGTVSGANFTGSGSSRTATFNHTFSTSGSKSIRACFNGGGPGTAAGNSVSAAHNHVVNADSTGPVITPNVVGTLGSNGWYTSNVTVSWTVTDPESTVTSQSGCGSSSVTSDTNGTTFTCTATSAGGTSNQSVTIKRDATAPTINATRSPLANANGWNNTDVTVSYTCSDSSTPGSGLASGACPANDTVTTEGANQSRSGTVTDQAGNTASTTVNNINIDKTAPTINATRTPAANANGWNNSDVTVSYTCSDALSGLDSSGCAADDTVSTEGANQSVSGNVTDKAGNSATATVNNINIDKTAPTISGSRTPAANANGWNNTNVTVSYNCADSLSGVDSCAAADTVTTEGANQSRSGTVTDKAGNTASTTVNNINIDKTAPVINASRSPNANANGWNNSDVTVSYTCSDALSGLDSSGCAADDTVSTEGANQSVSGNVTDKAGNSATATVNNINIDKTAPTITGSRTPAANANGWNNTNVTVSYNCADSLSGVDSCSANDTVTTEGANQSVSGNVTDKAGNSASTTVNNINIDKTNPSVALVGGPSNGNSYDFGSVPNTPTCSASDALSGLDGSCTVSGYSNAVGTHTVTATAKDKAANTNTASSTYTVKPYNLNGFYQPIDMNDTVNTVKNGSTVPVKFELFQSISGTELQSTSAVTSILARPINCAVLNGDPEDPIETLATGGTSLRYDTTAGQFIYNWATPKGASQVGKCYSLTMTAADTSTITAYFKLK